MKILVFSLIVLLLFVGIIQCKTYKGLIHSDEQIYHYVGKFTVLENALLKYDKHLSSFTSGKSVRYSTILLYSESIEHVVYNINQSSCFHSKIKPEYSIDIFSPEVTIIDNKGELEKEWYIVVSDCDKSTTSHEIINRETFKSLKYSFNIINPSGDFLNKYWPATEFYVQHMQFLTMFAFVGLFSYFIIVAHYFHKNDLNLQLVFYVMLSISTYMVSMFFSAYSRKFSINNDSFGVLFGQLSELFNTFSYHLLLMIIVLVGLGWKTYSSLSGNGVLDPITFSVCIKFLIGTFSIDFFKVEPFDIFSSYIYPLDSELGIWSCLFSIFIACYFYALVNRSYRDQHNHHHFIFYNVLFTLYLISPIINTTFIHFVNHKYQYQLAVLLDCISTCFIYMVLVFVFYPSSNNKYVQSFESCTNQISCGDDDESDNEEDESDGSKVYYFVGKDDLENNDPDSELQQAKGGLFFTIKNINIKYKLIK